MDKNNHGVIDVLSEICLSPCPIKETLCLLYLPGCGSLPGGRKERFLQALRVVNWEGGYHGDSPQKWGYHLYNIYNCGDLSIYNWNCTPK